MFESAVAYIDEYLLAGSAGVEMPARNGNRLPEVAPHECFRCADGVDGSDEWIAISVRDDETWLRLAEEADLDRIKWRTAEGRKSDEGNLEAALTEWTRGWNSQTLQHRLQAIGVPAAAVHSTLTHLRDPHLSARDWWLHLTHADTGTRQYQGFPWRLRRRPASCDRPAPRMGEHTLEILHGTLGLTEAEVERLLEDDVVAGLTARRDPDDLPPKPISPR